MDIQKNEKSFNNAKLKKAVALSIMFTAGVSAFASGHGKGRLFEKEAYSYNEEAVEDYIKMDEFLSKSFSKKGGITESDRRHFNAMVNQFDKDYGDGANIAIEDIKRENIELYPKTYGDLKNPKKWNSPKYSFGKESLITHSVNDAANLQRELKIKSNSFKKPTLRDYMTKKAETDFDYSR